MPTADTLHQYAREQGRRAYTGGYAITDNPFPSGTPQHDGFAAGYRAAHQARAPKIAPHLQASARR